MSVDAAWNARKMNRRPVRIRANGPSRDELGSLKMPLASSSTTSARTDVATTVTQSTWSVVAASRPGDLNMTHGRARSYGVRTSAAAALGDHGSRCGVTIERLMRTLSGTLMNVMAMLNRVML